MTVYIKKGKASGQVSAPPSKSLAHRLLICAGLSEGESIVHGVTDCDDVAATIDCLSSFGVKLERISENSLKVRGVDFTKNSPDSPLFCRESGSTLRFFLPLALLSGKNVMLEGAPSLMRRPMQVYEDICREQGLLYTSDGKSIVVRGKLPSGNYTVVGNVSSQFISGLLFALPLADGESTITITPPVESRPYIDLTLSALHLFGIEADWSAERTILIKGGQHYTPKEVTVEGDYSGAAFLDALNVLGGNVKVNGLEKGTLQGDSIYPRYFEMLSKGSPAIHIGGCPDLGPVMFALAAAKFGGVFSGTARLKIKESDRAAAMAEELRKFGVSVTVEHDSVVIYPTEFHAPTVPLCGHGDHRIVMSLAVLLTLTGGSITGAEAARKSFPAFFTKLSNLGIEVSENEA